MLSVQQAGISLKLVVDRNRLEQIIDKARTLARSLIPIVGLPAFEQYYDGPQEVVSAESLMQYLPRLLDEEYRLLFNSKLQLVREHLQSQKSKHMESIQLTRQIQSAMQLKRLASRKNDLVEKHALVDAKIESERHRLEICRDRARYLKSCKEVVLENQFAEINLSIDRELRLTSEELQQMADVKGRELQSHFRTVETVLRLQKSSNSLNLQRFENARRVEAAALWEDYNKRTAQIQQQLKRQLEVEQNFISQLVSEYKQQATLQQMDFKNTVKGLTEAPQPATQQQMERHLHRIEQLKRRLEQTRKESSQTTPQYRKYKRELKSLIAEFEEMVRSRQLLKKTLRI